MASKKKKVTKKTTTKMAPIKKAKSKPGKLTKTDLAYFQTLLLKKRQEIQLNVLNIGDGALKQSRQNAAGDLSMMPVHMADIGSDTFEQEFALELMEGERQLLREIDEALQRIDAKTYGICEGTGSLISRARLEAKPWAKYCVEYAREMESRG